MPERKSVIDYGRYFSKHLPSIWVLTAMLVALSLALSISSVMIAHYGYVYTDPVDLAISGAVVGLLMLIIPTILTTFFAKLATRRMAAKHLFFMSFIGCAAFGTLVLLSSVLDALFGPAIAVIVVIVGASSIFGWWFFAERMISSKANKSALLALVQPTLFILFYIPSSSLMFSAGMPTNILLVKLYSGIVVFGLVIYAIMYVFNRPVKKSMGFNALDIFSAIVQEWLFGINAYKPFNDNYGNPEDIPVQGVSIGSNASKAMLLIPMLHYGIMGNIGGSNFPYLVERYGSSKYRNSTLVMHPAINEDFNPVSAGQVSRLKRALDDLASMARPVGRGMTFSVGEYRSSRVTELSMGKVSIVTLTRAPRVTEDVAMESAALFRRMLEERSGNSVILIDAHNSRYESAKSSELAGVGFNSQYMREYVEAIRSMKVLHRSRSMRIGVGSVDLYSRLKAKTDIARGNLNVLLFRFNGFSYAMLQFNCNNMLPSLRNQIVGHVMDKYGITAEVYTTDTHAVNSISMNASNVLGRQTRFGDLVQSIDECMGLAMGSVEPVQVSYASTEMKGFMVWGRNTRERLFSTLTSLSKLARVIVPAIIVLGFLIAAWVVLLI